MLDAEDTAGRAADFDIAATVHGETGRLERRARDRAGPRKVDAVEKGRQSLDRQDRTGRRDRRGVEAIADLDQRTPAYRANLGAVKQTRIVARAGDRISRKLRDHPAIFVQDVRSGCRRDMDLAAN